MRNKVRYTDKVLRTITVVKAELEDKGFIKYTTSNGNELTTQYTNQVELGVEIKAFITYDNLYNKYRLLDVIKEK